MEIQYFNNLKFRLDKKTGYYISSKMLLKNRQERMHRYVWKFYNGEIPDNHDIHHIDKNKSNNNIENLQLINKKLHQLLHKTEYYKNNKDKVIDNLNNIRHLTKEWHASKEGHKWHKKHYEENKDKIHAKIVHKCLNCNTEFINIKHAKVCSNKCKSAIRRKNGIDNIVKICIICNNSYEVNKYAKTKTCSRKCGRKIY